MKPCPNCSRPMFVNSKYKICEHCRESKKRSYQKKYKNGRNTQLWQDRFKAGKYVIF